MSSKENKREPFFYYMGLVLLITVVFAFGSYSIVGMSKFNSWPPIIAVHGVSLLSWYILFAYQAKLVGIKDIQRHKKMGQLSLGLAIIIIISGISIGISNYQVMKMPFEILANFIFILSFAAFYSFAIKYRFKSDIHKRLMLLASMAMLPPAISRIARVFNLDDKMMGPPFLLFFFFTLIIYDYRKTKKIHKSTLVGIVSIIVVYSAIGPLGSSDAWSNLLVSIFGN